MEGGHDQERAAGHGEYLIRGSASRELLSLTHAFFTTLASWFHLAPAAVSHARIPHDSRIVQLIDLCGHLKYLKTTISGLTGLQPHFVLVLVAANKGGVPRMTKEHVGIVCALKIPVAIIVTKCDIAPPDVFKSTMKKVRGMLRLARKLPLVIRGVEQIDQAARQVGNGGRIAPIFLTSNVTGEGLDSIRAFLAVLRPPAAPIAGGAGGEGGASEGSAEADECVGASGGVGAAKRAGIGANAAAASYEQAAECAVVQDGDAGAAAVSPLVRIDASFLVTGCGCVLSGLTMQGTVAANDTLLLGPDRAGHWRRVTVRSIQSHQQPLEKVSDRRQAAFAIKAVHRKEHVRCSDIRRGMVLVGDAPFSSPTAYWTFDAELLVLHHQTTMRVGYAPIVHIFFVRQAAQIVKITKLTKGGTKSPDDGTASECLRTGDRAIVRFRFLYYAEHLVPGSMLLMREGRAKAVGHIVGVGSPDGTAASAAAAAAATKAKTLRGPRRQLAKVVPDADVLKMRVPARSNVDAAGAALADLQV